MSAAIGYLRRHHVGLLALFVALGGTAYSVATIGPDDIQRNAVKGRHIGANQVTGADTNERSLAVSQIIARVRSNADRSAPATPTRAAYTLQRGRTYRQKAGEIDDVRGVVEVFFPAGCIAVGPPGFANRSASVYIFRNGDDQPFATGSASSFGAPGGDAGDDTIYGGVSTAFNTLGSAPPPFEATTNARRTLRAEVDSFCDPASTARPVVRSVKFDVISNR
jgi:hypothetical protein